jgi:predicted  nucleic acid-binding Zn-ribbon protein
MAVSLEFIQSQLKAIQTELREMKFGADVDRRNAASLYNNLAAEFGASIGKLDAKVEMGFEVVNERIDRLEARIDGLEARIDGLEVKVDAGFARIEAKVDAGFARIERLLSKD